MMELIGDEMIIDSELYEMIKEAESGAPEKLWDVGNYYYEGYGTRKNSLKAFRYFLRSAKKDYPIAQRDLAMFYYENKRYQKAADWYLKAYENYDVIFSDFMSRDTALFNACICYFNAGDHKNAWKYLKILASDSANEMIKKEAIDMLQKDYIGKVVKYRKDPSEKVEFKTSF